MGLPEKDDRTSPRVTDQQSSTQLLDENLPTDKVKSIYYGPISQTRSSSYAWDGMQSDTQLDTNLDTLQQTDDDANLDADQKTQLDANLEALDQQTLMDASLANEMQQVQVQQLGVAAYVEEPSSSHTVPDSQPPVIRHERIKTQLRVQAGWAPAARSSRFSDVSSLKGGSISSWGKFGIVAWIVALVFGLFWFLTM